MRFLVLMFCSLSIFASPKISGDDFRHSSHVDEMLRLKKKQNDNHLREDERWHRQEIELQKDDALGFREKARQKYERLKTLEDRENRCDLNHEEQRELNNLQRDVENGKSAVYLDDIVTQKSELFNCPKNTHGIQPPGTIGFGGKRPKKTDTPTSDSRTMGDAGSAAAAGPVPEETDSCFDVLLAKASGTIPNVGERQTLLKIHGALDLVAPSLIGVISANAQNTKAAAIQGKSGHLFGNRTNRTICFFAPAQEGPRVNWVLGQALVVLPETPDEAIGLARAAFAALSSARNDVGRLELLSKAHYYLILARLHGEHSNSIGNRFVSLAAKTIGYELLLPNNENIKNYFEKYRVGNVKALGDEPLMEQAAFLLVTAEHFEAFYKSLVTLGTLKSGARPNELADCVEEEAKARATLEALEAVERAEFWKCEAGTAIRDAKKVQLKRLRNDRSLAMDRQRITREQLLATENSARAGIEKERLFGFFQILMQWEANVRQRLHDLLANRLTRACARIQEIMADKIRHDRTVRYYIQYADGYFMPITQSTRQMPEFGTKQLPLYVKNTNGDFVKIR